MSQPRIFNFEQRSAEWYAIRLGLVTASTVGRLITTSKPDATGFECVECSAPATEPCIGVRGKPVKYIHGARHEAADAADDVLTVADNDTARGLILTLAAERITGRAEEGPAFSRDLERGVISEPFARDAYADHNGITVEEVGFMIRDFDGYSIGYSPDGLTPDGGIEIKSPRAKGHISTVLADKVPSQYMAQVQTALLVTGREWCDYVSFHGGLHLWTKRVHPDPAWFAVIHAAAAHAEQQIADITDRYQAAVKGLPLTDVIPDPYADVELKLS